MGNKSKNKKGSFWKYSQRKVVKDTEKRFNLKQVLESIYVDYVNLETTCNHVCDCCNVAMPQLNYSEFVQIITELWPKLNNAAKLDMICKSIEYFFRYDYEKWATDSLIKPCMLLEEKTKLCSIYESRPLNCRMYGLWPKEDYEKRVDRFAKVYENYGLKRENLPLNTQCPFVKRVDDSKPLTTEVINGLFAKLDDLDKKVGNFTDLQVAQKENYRTFHDWLLLKVLEESWLTKLTSFLMAADKEAMEDQIRVIKDVFTKEFLKNGIPDIVRKL